MAQLVQFAGGGYCPELKLFLGQGTFQAWKHDDGTYSLEEPASLASPKISVEFTGPDAQHRTITGTDIHGNAVVETITHAAIPPEEEELTDA